MKRIIFMEIMRRTQSKPKLKKKLKVFALIGVIGFFVTSGLVIWAGVSAFQFASNQIQAVNVPSHLRSARDHLAALPGVATVNCWDKAQSLLNLESWVTKPLADNFKNLKTACLEDKSPICAGQDCQDLKMRMNTAEREQTI